METWIFYQKREKRKKEMKQKFYFIYHYVDLLCTKFMFILSLSALTTWRYLQNLIIADEYTPEYYFRRVSLNSISAPSEYYLYLQK